MISRLLACLALLTGLVAVGTPAQAAVYAGVAAGVEQAAPTARPCKGEACDSAADRRQPRRASGQRSAARPVPVITIVIPTVQFGPDRARE